MVAWVTKVAWKMFFSFNSIAILEEKKTCSQCFSTNLVWQDLPSVLIWYKRHLMWYMNITLQLNLEFYIYFFTHRQQRKEYLPQDKKANSRLFFHYFGWKNFILGACFSFKSTIFPPKQNWENRHSPPVYHSQTHELLNFCIQKL